MNLAPIRVLAVRLHQGQTDKIGRPYTEHIFAVADGVALLGGSRVEKAAAYLHDAVEDGHTTIEGLREEQVPDEVLVLVEALTKRPGESRSAYIDRVVAAGPGAMRIKVADLLHNTRADRLDEVLRQHGLETVLRLLRKYRPELARLMAELRLTA